eukprot:7391883-Prymnesium_polylepis.1
MEALEARVRAAELKPQRQQRQFEYAKQQAAADMQAVVDAKEEMHKDFCAELKEQKRTHAFEVNELRGEWRAERAEAGERVASLEGMIRELQRQVQRAQAALRKGGKEAEREKEQLTGEMERLREGRVWASVREEEAKRRRVEAQRDELKAEVARLTEQVHARSRKHSAEMDELYTLRGRVKALQKLNATYDVKTQRKFFEVDPILEQKADLERQVASLRQQLKAQQEETARFKAVAQPPKSKFFRSGHYTSDVDLLALEMIASCGISPNVAPKLFVMFANFYGVTLPSRQKKVLTGTDAEGKRMYEVKDVLFIPGKTHMKELPAIGGELHKMQASELLNLTRWRRRSVCSNIIV